MPCQTHFTYSICVSKSSIRDAVCVAVAAALRRERERQQLSMSAVAARAGISQQMVSYVERGLRNPTLDTLLRITDALECDLAALIQDAAKSAKRRKP